jgi:cysteine synthase B
MGILQCIGNTPLVRIDSINPNPRVKVFAKLEGNNPGGSVKDRIAFYMIEAAERNGKLTRDKIILEAFGAELILSPSDEGTDGAIRIAQKILSEEPENYFMPNQFNNEANILAHYETTGKEIIEQTGGRITTLCGRYG